jgi:glycerol-3-phosphate dehydrogenase
VLDKTQGKLARQILFPVPHPQRGKGILVSQTFHGNLLLGPTSRDLMDPRQRDMTNEQVIKTILDSAHQSLPAFDPKHAITSFSGWRAKCDRGDFVIEESNVARFINVAGIDSPGLTSSPAVAALVVDILRGGGCPLDKNPDFTPFRAPIIRLKDAYFKGQVDHADPKLNIICRCERVTEAEVVDALHRPLPATNVEAVRRYTRCGMGPCQGSFCEPRVVDLISRELHIPIAQVKRRGAGSSLLPHRRINAEDKVWLKRLETKL